MKVSLLHKPVVHVLLIISLCLIAYSNTFHVPFQFDDKDSIVEKKEIRDFDYLIKPLKEGSFARYSGIKMRYIGYLTFGLNYRLHGLDVTGYHIFNLAVHVINALLVYFLIVATFKTPVMRQNGSPAEQTVRLIALFSSLFFLSHPIQTQAVTYIVQRYASLAAMFYMLSLFMYVKARLVMTYSEGRRFFPVTLYILSLVSAILAMKTKEMAFTLPLVVILYEFIFFKGSLRRRILYVAAILMTMAIVPLSMVGMNKPIGEIIGDVSKATMVQTQMSRLDYLYTQFRVIVTYIRLVFFPVNQNLDYDYPLYNNFFNIEVLLSFMFLLFIFGLGMYLFYRYRNTAAHTRLITFGILWFFVTLSVESGIIPIVDVIFEHRMYLPSVGLFMSVSTALFTGIEKLDDKREGAGRTVIALLAVIVVILAGASYARNKVWKSEQRLWEDVVRKSPDKARGHNNLANAYTDQHDKAIKHYKIALSKIKTETVKGMSEYYGEIHYNLASTYNSKGMDESAIRHYELAIKIYPRNADAYNNLGVIYFDQGSTDRAIEYYQSALRKKKDHVNAYFNLAEAYFLKGFIDKSITNYKVFLKYMPDYAEAHYNIAAAYMAKDEKEKASKHFSNALRLDPGLKSRISKMMSVEENAGD